MKFEIKAIFFVMILLFVTSCTYDFSEDSFKEIQASDPNANITLTGFTNGEKTSSSKIIQYVILGVGNEEFEMTIKVDEEEIYRSQESTGEFYLYVDELVEGEHKLTIEYIFPTNSGSLVDSLGGEFFIVKSIYNFTLDKTLADPFGIESVNIVEGSIYINLNSITDNNFDEVFLLIKNEDDIIIEERPILQGDLSDLQIHDDQTIIYNPSFAIKVKNAFTEKVSEFILLPTVKVSFNIEPILYRTFKLQYNAHPLYGNFEAFGFNYYNYLVGDIYYNLNPQGDETIIDDEFYFGTTHSITINFIRNDYVIGSVNDQIKVGDYLPISEFEEITYIPSVDKYFIIDVTNNRDLVIYQLNGQSFEIENSQTLITLDYSGDFNSLEIDPISNNLIVNMDKKALVFNPITFSIINTYNAIEYNADKAYADVYYRGEYLILEESWESGEVLIYEIATGVLKFSINKTTNFFSAVDASFFYANGGLYKRQGDSFVFEHTVQDSEDNIDAQSLEHMTFDKLSNSAVFGWYRTSYYLDLSNYDQTRIWDTALVYDVKYTDEGKPFINCNHFSAGNKSHLYDINLNETKLIDTYTQQSYRYFNGFIFSPSGFYLESNLYTNL